MTFYAGVLKRFGTRRIWDAMDCKRVVGGFPTAPPPTWAIGKAYGVTTTSTKPFVQQQ